jgi:carbonic anhydrase/acetyltransferase-like protein (isoleucine patch superfamily)
VGHHVMLHGCPIRENSLIGLGAINLNKAVIGKNCRVGAGAMVTEGKSIPDGSLVLGVPGKVVRSLTPEEIATNTWIAEHYVERSGIYRRGLKPLG